MHKYAYVHGDPVQGVDPTGMFLGAVGSLGAVGIAMEMHISTLTQGALTIATLNTIGDAGMQLRRTGLELLASGNLDAGFALYELGGSIFGLAADVIETSNNGIDLFSLGVAGIGIIRVLKSGLSPSSLRKIGQAFTDVRRSSKSVSAFAQQFGPRYLGRDPLSPGAVKIFEHAAAGVKRTRGGKPMKVRFERVEAGSPHLIDPATNNPVRGRYRAWQENGIEHGVIYVRKDATLYEIQHEMHHMQHHFDIGADYRTSLNRAQREWVVYNRTFNSNMWDNLTDLEKKDAAIQRDFFGVDVPPPPLQ